MTARSSVSPARTPSARGGWPAKKSLVVLALATAAAMCAVAAPLGPSTARSLALAAPAPGAAAATATTSRPGCSPPLLATFTSHKTGTAQAGCLVARALESNKKEVVHSYENSCNGSHAVVTFAAAATASGSCPAVLVYTAGDYLPRVEDAHCPFPACPCDASGRALCESLEAGTLAIPGGNTTTLAQIRRQPLDVVLSAFLYHRQEPAPEPWIESVGVHALGAACEGAPLAPLRGLGWRPGRGFAGAGPRQSYGSFLRQLPLHQAIRLEFWRSSRSLHGTARMHASLAALRGRGTRVLPLRFEALRDSFNATAGALLAAFAERLPGLDTPALLQRVQQCDPGAWSAQQRQVNAAHVTAGKGDPEQRSRLQAVLWSDGAIRRRLCRLTAALDYPQPPECSASGTLPSSTA